MTAHQYSTVVVGGGITGAFTAYFLAKNDHSVALFDSREHDHVASFVNPGGLNPLHGKGIPGDMEDFFMYSFELHKENWPDIRELSGVDFDGRLIHRLFLAFTDEEKASLLERKPLYDKRENFSAEWMDAAELQKEYEGVNPEVIGGLYTYGNASVSPEKYHRAVTGAAVALGAKSVVATVESVQPSDKTVTLDNGDMIGYDNLALCCGPHRELSEQAGYEDPVRPYKGDLLIATLSGKRLDYDITCGFSGIYQYDDGKYCLGGTFSDAGFDDSVEENAREKILQQCSNMLPEQKFLVEEHLVGFRPGSADGRPIVGRVAENIFIATGAGSKGMLLCTGLGDAVTTMIGGRDCEIVAHLSPFRPTLG